MKKFHKALISSVIGNALEGYDYILYATFSFILSSLFFPTADNYTSLIATFGAFAAGFLMRPIGAIIFGHIGDKHSRKLALSLSIMLMSIPTTLIGVLPTYAEIGILAPILLVVIRLIQGLSVGGETGSVITYLVETSPNSTKKAVIGSLAASSGGLGFVLGFLAVYIYTGYFSDVEWAWRVPFLLSFPLGLIGFYIRLHLDDSVEFLEIKNLNLTAKSPFKELFKNHKKRFFVLSGLYVAVMVQYYIFFAFLYTLMMKVWKYNQSHSSLIYIICALTLAVTATISGLVSDKFGIRKILFFILALTIASIQPIFQLILSADFTLTFVGCLMFVSLIGFYQGNIVTLILNFFPTKVRTVGTAFSFNIVVAIFGGLTPVLLTYLLKSTHDNYNIVPLYIILACCISLVSAFAAKRMKLL